MKFSVVTAAATVAAALAVVKHADHVGIDFDTPEAAQFNLVMLPNSAEEGAVCIDGTPIGFYWQEGSGLDAYNWMVYFEGGGWVRSRARMYR
jgi:hypothetical protein